MRLGYIHIWGKEKNPVSEVNLVYNGNKESVNFENPDLEVSDVRKCLFLNGAIQNVYMNVLYFLALKKHNYGSTITSLFIYFH